MSKYKPDAGKADLRQHIPDGVLSDRKTLAKLSKVDALNIPDGILPNKEAEAFLHTITADAPRDDRPQPKVRTATLDGYRETAKRIGKRHTPQPDAEGKGEETNCIHRIVCEFTDQDGLCPCDHYLTDAMVVFQEQAWNPEQPPLDMQALADYFHNAAAMGKSLFWGRLWRTVANALQAASEGKATIEKGG